MFLFQNGKKGIGMVGLSLYLTIICEDFAGLVPNWGRTETELRRGGPKSGELLGSGKETCGASIGYGG